MGKSVIAWLCCIIPFLLSGCLGVTTSEQKPLVVCTTGMIADVVTMIGGDEIAVKSLMGPGIDPHVYRARAGDIELLSRANLILYNGLHLEGKMTELFQKMAQYKATVGVAESIGLQQLRPSAFAGLYDPHVWHDVGLWRQIVPVIEKQLSSIAPEHAATFHERAVSYARELDALDNWVRDQVGRLKTEQRILVTAHDAFGYFGKAYGFEVVGLQGISTDAEIGVRDIQELVAFVVEKKVRTLFVESSIPRRSLQAVQQAVQAQGWHVALGDDLFSDALGDATTGGQTYIAMIKHNVTVIVNGLCHD